MTAYYNEIDPRAAAWLRELIKQGHIAPGEVDETDIRDVDPDRLGRYTQCHFFAGIGGWSLALRLAGWPDSRPVWTGSCPCQPFSAAGRRAGTADERHLWPHWHHLISQCQPAVIFGEQVASKDGLGWLDLVQADMEATGYAFAAQDICAAGLGAPHIRQRLWFVGLADAKQPGLERQPRHGDDRHQPGRLDANAAGSVAEASISSSVDDRGRPGPTNGRWRDADWLFCRDGKWRPVEPGTFPLAHGLPARVGRLRGYGNAIVPQVAAAWIEAVIEYEREQP